MLDLPSVETRQEALRVRRERLSGNLLSNAPVEALLIVPSGTPVPIAGTDQYHQFHAHNDHVWLSGSRRLGAVLVFDSVDTDAWTLFVPTVSREDRVWHGPGDELEQIAELTGIGQVRPRSEFESYLVARRERPVAFLGHREFLERPGAYGVHPDIVAQLQLDADLSVSVEQLVHDGRRCKDGFELDLMRAAAVATAAGHAAGLEAMQDGASERAVAAEIEAGFRRAGADGAAYDSIVAGGPNAAVLHARPTHRRMRADEFMLVDAGAEVDGYDCDVTRTSPVDGRLEGRRKALHDAVLDVQEKAIEGSLAGREYRDVHMEASVGLAAGLVSLGILTGEPEDLVQLDAHALFFPHGVGHLIGLGTHDVGGYAEGRTRSDRPGLRYLRADLPLAPGMVVTIEPGLYFIEALLAQGIEDRRYQGVVDFDEARKWLPLGGVRIEDTVCVRADGPPEVLTGAIPK
ncbi:MAG: M24 family metallopeptidase [bacterium]|nr:M24 family metallopeptidase [bacterium]